MMKAAGFGSFLSTRRPPAAVRAAVAYRPRIQTIRELVHQAGFFGQIQNLQSFFLRDPAAHSQIDIVVGVEAEHDAHLERLLAPVSNICCCAAQKHLVTAMRSWL